jgi:HK97 family phage major capsid protein
VSDLVKLIKEQAMYLAKREALSIQVKEIETRIATKEAEGEDTGEDTGAFNSLIEDIKEVSSKLATVATRLARLASVEEANEPETPPGADEDGEKNYRQVTTKGLNPMSKVHSNFNINTRGKQVEPKNSEFEKVMWEQMARFIANDQTVGYGQRGAAEWAQKFLPGNDLAEFVAKSSFMVQKGPMDTSTPIIPQTWINDPIGLLWSESSALGRFPREQVRGGQATVPKVMSAPTFHYVGETQQATSSTQTYERLQTTWHEYQGVADITKELIYFNPLDAGARLAADMKNGLERFLLTEAIYGDGSAVAGATGVGTITRVKGLINQANSSNYATASSVSGAIDATTVSNDYGHLQLFFSDNNIEVDGAFHLTTKGIDQFNASARNQYNYYFPEYGSTRKINGIDVVSTQLMGNNDTLVVGGVTLTGAMIITVQPKFTRFYEFSPVQFLTSDIASYNSGGNTISAFANRTVVFNAYGTFDFLVHQDQAVSLFNDNKLWTLSNASGKSYVTPTSVPYSPAASGAKSSS